MKNPLTFRVESSLGVLYIVVWSAFLTSLIFIAIKNFNSEISILESSASKIKIVSNQERLLIKEWVDKNNIEIPEGKGVRYLTFQYPYRPWYDF